MCLDVRSRQRSQENVLYCCACMTLWTQPCNLSTWEAEGGGAGSQPGLIGSHHIARKQQTRSEDTIANRALLAGRLASKGCTPFLQHLRSKGEAARWVKHSELQDSQDPVSKTKPNHQPNKNPPKPQTQTNQTKRILYCKDEEDFFILLLQLSAPYSSLLYSMINISKV